MVLGAGGSARAVGTALATSGCATLVIANRTAPRGEPSRAASADLGGVPIAVAYRSARSGCATARRRRLVVNTTPAGLAAEPAADRRGATPQCLFVDLVYGRPPEPLPRARARGRAGGRSTAARMLLHQGALAFEAWTGRPAPRAAMARALRAAGLTLTEPRRRR